MGLIAPIGLIVCFIIAGVAEASTYGGIDTNSILAIVTGLFMLLFMIMGLATFGIGIGAFVQKGYKKVLPIIGFTFSTVELLMAVILMIIGANAGY
ncbi:MAG TPA: hypothetical protein VIM93_07210 [Kangiella sp.]